jgi:hypothetical protein
VKTSEFTALVEGIKIDHYCDLLVGTIGWLVEEFICVRKCWNRINNSVRIHEIVMEQGKFGVLTVSDRVHRGESEDKR